jgi:hypothetical protein
MTMQRKSDATVLLGSALVALGHRNFVRAGDHLRRSGLMIEHIAAQKGIVLDAEPWPELTYGTVSGMTALLVAAITSIAKNNLQDGYIKVRDAGVMLGKMVEQHNARRQGVR